MYRAGPGNPNNLNRPGIELTPGSWTNFEGFYGEVQGIDPQSAALVEDVAGRKTTSVKFTSTKKVEMDTFTCSILGVMAMAAVGGALASPPSYLGP